MSVSTMTFVVPLETVAEPAVEPLRGAPSRPAHRGAQAIRASSAVEGS